MASRGRVTYLSTWKYWDPCQWWQCTQGRPHVQGCQHFLILQSSAQRFLQVAEVGLLTTYILCPYACIWALCYNVGKCIFCYLYHALSLCIISFLLLPYPFSKQRLEEPYLNSKILTEFPEGNIRLTKLKSPTYTLPSGPAAKATGAKSLLLRAGPLQLVQATLRWCPLPIMVAMTGGCWEMNIFSPFPLCIIPRSQKKREN